MGDGISLRDTDRPLMRLGAASWIIGVAQFFITHLIVQRAWTSPYSWSRNNISDLGHVSCMAWGDDGRYICSPLHAWMNASFVLQGALLLLGLGLARSLWDGTRAARVARTLLALAGFGWIVAGLAPADLHENIHVVLGALPLFFCGNLGLALTGATTRRVLAGPLCIAALFLGIGGLLVAALFLNNRYLGLGMGGMERCVVFPSQIWVVLAGVAVLWASRSVPVPSVLPRDKRPSPR